jgi:signal transduction histidine kinase
VTTASNIIRFPLEPTDDESIHAAGHRHIGPEFLAAPAQPSHFVQFYEEEESLFEMVGKFLGAGLQAGDRLLVVATEAHRTGFMLRLEPLGGLRALESGQLTMLDARETLDKFMVDGTPDPHRFRLLIDSVIAKAKAGGIAPIRAYGEMVDLLWRDGNCDAAIRLEELWNDAGVHHAFSLFCAYTIGNFYKEGGARFFDVCRTHTHVIPTESVTRQRALEKEIAHRKDLEDALRAALRKRAQAEEDLRTSLRREQEARAEAEAAVKFRELFVGILGHDLRNPLNTMLNTAQLMLMRADVSEEGQKRLGRVIASGTRMQRMIEQILDVTRDRLAGGISIQRTYQHLDRLVVRIVEESRAARPGREIACIVQGDCSASVDADRFEQVVSNLIGNAITHGEKDKPITVVLSGSALSVKLSVHNHGRPIDPKFMPHLFDPFARLEKPEGRSEGLGLGLFIVDRITKAHGGRIFASSSGETGTTFEVTLPRHDGGSQP